MSWNKMIQTRNEFWDFFFEIFVAKRKQFYEFFASLQFIHFELICFSVRCGDCLFKSWPHYKPLDLAYTFVNLGIDSSMVYVYDTLQVFLANFTALDSKLFDLEFVFFCCSQPFLARYSNRSCILRHGYITIYIARILVGPCSYTHGCNFIRCHNPSVSFCILYSFPRDIALNNHFKIFQYSQYSLQNAHRSGKRDRNP